MARLLIVDDEPGILGTLRRALELDGYTVDVAGGGKQALERAAKVRFDAVMLDVMMPDMDGLTALSALRELHADLPVIMMSGDATLATAVQATKRGACDFLEKPLSVDKVLLTLQNALKLARLEREAAEGLRQARADRALLGTSPAMQQVLDVIARVAVTNARVLITGERGTGKELVARALHAESRRKDAPFIKLNCAAIPAELVESELFGHEKGAFTGATRERAGKFEQAHGGTLFLDEIGDMTLSAQAKVLRVLQENEIERVGGDEMIPVDVRVVAATNKELPAEVAAGRFRADLFDRLNVVPIAMPPLRAHRQDVPILVEHFLHVAAQQNGKKPPRIEPAALTLLMQHDWPGNVRELRNTVERLVIFSDAVIGDAQVTDVLPGARAVPGSYRRGVALKELVATAERELVRAALEANDHKMAATARELGLERSHLYKKVRALGLEVAEPADDCGD